MTAPDRPVPPVLVQLLADDIRSAAAHEMLPPAALAEALVRRGWRPAAQDEAIEVPANAASRAEAERRWPMPDAAFLATYSGTWTLTGVSAEAVKAGNRDGFVQGAAWQAAEAAALRARVEAVIDAQGRDGFSDTEAMVRIVRILADPTPEAVRG